MITMEANGNPFSRRQHNVPPATSPINEVVPPEDVAKASKKSIRAPKAVPAKVEPKPAVEQGTVSDKPDNGDVTPQVDPTTPPQPITKTYTNDELLPILDSLLNHGYALYTFKVRNTEIILRTRFTWEEQYVYSHLEASNVKTALMYQREYALIILAASLVKYGDYLFEPLNEGEDDKLKESIIKRYDFVRSLNSVLTDIVQIKLGEFDDKQRYIITNFDELLKAF